MNARAAIRFAALLIGLLGPVLFAQSQATPKLYRIAGSVTNSVSHEPVTGATLTLFGGQPRLPVQTIQADAAGHFQFEPVPADKYALSASRRGYMPSAFDEHEGFSSAVVTGDTQDTEHISFRLSPGSTIRGIVTDDAGEPVEEANVLLVLKTHAGGMGEHLVKIVSGPTDDNGMFEFFNLFPGTYFLAVKADPWFALHPPPKANNSARSTLDVAYPVTYYASSTTEAEATPIQIANGEQVHANVTLHAVPALRLTMLAPTVPQDEQRFNPALSLRQTVFGDQDFLSPNFSEQPPAPGSGLVEFSGIAPGHYTVAQGNPPRISEIDATGSRQVDLSSGLQTFELNFEARMADRSPPPENLRLTLQSDDRALRIIEGQRAGPSSMKFFSVPPGRWNVIATGGVADTLAVVSVQTGTDTVADSRIVVKDHPLSATAVLASGKVNIEGLAARDGKGEPGVMIVLVPKDPAACVAQFRRDQSDSDGSFLLPDVIPGDYTAIAIEDGWTLDWKLPEVLASYLPAGTPITVAPSSTTAIRLATPLKVQPR